MTASSRTTVHSISLSHLGWCSTTTWDSTFSNPIFTLVWRRQPYHTRKAKKSLFFSHPPNPDHTCSALKPLICEKLDTTNRAKWSVKPFAPTASPGTCCGQLPIQSRKRFVVICPLALHKNVNFFQPPVLPMGINHTCYMRETDGHMSCLQKQAASTFYATWPQFKIMWNSCCARPRTGGTTCNANWSLLRTRSCLLVPNILWLICGMLIRIMTDNALDTQGRQGNSWITHKSTC